MFEINKNPSRAELRTFGFGILLGLGIIGVLCWWLMPRWFGADAAHVAKFHKTALVLWALGAAVCLLAVAAPIRVVTPVYVVWMRVAIAIGVVMTPVFFTLLFIVVLPIFSLIRLADPLRMNLSRAESYWEDHKDHEATVERALRPF